MAVVAVMMGTVTTTFVIPTTLTMTAMAPPMGTMMPEHGISYVVPGLSAPGVLCRGCSHPTGTVAWTGQRQDAC